MIASLQKNEKGGERDGIYTRTIEGDGGVGQILCTCERGRRR